jgi:hypothetical protein
VSFNQVYDPSNKPTLEEELARVSQNEKTKRKQVDISMDQSRVGKDVMQTKLVE